ESFVRPFAYCCVQRLVSLEFRVGSKLLAPIVYTVALRLRPLVLAANATEVLFSEESEFRVHRVIVVVALEETFDAFAAVLVVAGFLLNAVFQSELLVAGAIAGRMSFVPLLLLLCFGVLALEV